jgi:hypothetical protein
VIVGTQDSEIRRSVEEMCSSYGLGTLLVRVIRITDDKTIRRSEEPVKAVLRMYEGAKVTDADCRSARSETGFK